MLSMCGCELFMYYMDAKGDVRCIYSKGYTLYHGIQYIIRVWMEGWMNTSFITRKLGELRLTCNVRIYASAFYWTHQ